MRILLVEDNVDHRDLMSLALIGHDSTWEVKWASSGEEALRLLSGGEVFDLVFLDYSLPQRDGLFCLAEIRRSEASPPVVIVTGRGDEGVAVEAMKGGAYDYVVKQLGFLQRLPVVAWNAMEANRLALEHKRAEEQVRSSREQLRALSAHLQSVREEERIRIAREIHDELGQELTALKMDLSWLIKRFPKDQKLLVKTAKSMSKLIDTAIQSVRRISTGLRPAVLDDLGLTAAIEWQAQDFRTRTGIQCEFNPSFKETESDVDRSTTVFRVLQEALTNVARHAGATRVHISLNEEGSSQVLTVEDNGRGITMRDISDPKSLGLLGMQERAFVFGGEVTISGAPGKGTTVMLRIPMQQ